MQYSSIISGNYQFNISASTTTCTTKEDFSKVSSGFRYRKQPVTIEKLSQLIRDGHSICHCYDDNDEEFGNATKTQDSFRYTSFIPFDIDNNDMPMEEYITTLTYQPTIAYTTTSDGIIGMGNRYRLIYVFDGKIKGVEKYYEVFDWLRKECNIKDLKDNCTRSPHQPIFGNALPSCRMECSNLVYSLPPFVISEASIDRSNKQSTEKVSSRIKKRKKSVIDCDSTFMEDFKNLSFYRFVRKYGELYKAIDESELEYHDGYAEIDENYFRLRPKWSLECSPRTGRPYPKCQRWQDGEGRRRKLSITSLIIRKIKPDITAEHLLYCLAYQVVHHYNNSDGILNKKFVLRVVVSTMSKAIEEITIKGNDKRKFCIDKAYWAKRNVSPRAAVQKVRRLKNAAKISELYDASMTDKKNIENMAANGFKTSVSTLKRWRKELGIIKYKK